MWSRYDTYPVIPMGGKFLVDLPPGIGGTDYIFYIPDWTWSHELWSAGLVDPFSWDDPLPFPSLRFLFEYPATMDTFIDETVPEHYWGATSFVLHTQLIPTKYPDIDPTTGLMNGDFFYASWVRSVYYANGETGMEEELISTSVSGLYGLWESFLDFYENDLRGHQAQGFYFSVTSRAYMVAWTDAELDALAGTHGSFHSPAGAGAWPWVEVLKSRTHGPTSVGALDGRILGTDLQPVDYHDVDSVPNNEKYQQNWPWLGDLYDTSGAGADSVEHSARDYSKLYELLNGFNDYPGVYQDLYQRWFAKDYNAIRSSTYLEARYAKLTATIELSSELPKEYRVRMQPAKKFDLSKVGFLPTESMDITTSETSGPSSGGSGGGSGY